SRFGSASWRIAAVALPLAAIASIALWWPRTGRARVEQPAAAIEQLPRTTAGATPVAAPRAGPPLATEGTLVAADSLLVSIAIFRDAEGSGVVAREISAKGLPAFVRTDAADNSSSVLVGPYVSRDEAVDAQRQIAALGYQDTRIIVETH